MRTILFLLAVSFASATPASMVLVDTTASGNPALRPFLITRFEVTQEEYTSVVHRNPSYFRSANFPVDMVSWFGACEFCNARSVRDGLIPVYTFKGWTVKADKSANGYRLPTEAEWEFAARGGQSNSDDAFAGSANADEVAWFDGNSNQTYHAAGSKKPNLLGIFDMSGNVWEWCWDESPDKAAHDGESDDPHFAYHVIKGGSWYNPSSWCTIAFRARMPANYEANDLNIGIRLVRNP